MKFKERIRDEMGDVHHEVYKAFDALCEAVDELCDADEEDTLLDIMCARFKGEQRVTKRWEVAIGEAACYLEEDVEVEAVTIEEARREALAQARPTDGIRQVVFLQPREEEADD